MDPTTRLRIATRIHFALLRHYGETVPVSDLLQGGGDAREALWVCEASEHAELVRLEREFRSAGRAAARAAAAAPQELAWSRDTSGFGVSSLAALAPRGVPGDAAGATGRWGGLRRWLRGSSYR